MAGDDYLEPTPPWHGCRDEMLQFLPLALDLDSKAGTGLAIPVSPNAKNATTYTYAGVTLDPNSWDQRLDGSRLFSRPLFELMNFHPAIVTMAL